MEEIVAKILVWVCPVLKSQLDYLIHYESNISNLKDQKKMLEEARERLNRDVDTAKGNQMEIEADIMSRLSKYDDKIAMASKILDDDERSATITYCNGCCPNLISRYQLSKRADKTASEAKNLMEEGWPERVGYYKSTQVVGTVKLNRGYEDIESRKSTINGVLGALKDPNINRIGVHGMGGVGKTMLVKEVVNQAVKDNLFNNYVFVPVSKEPYLMDIQTKIANQLGLELGKADEFGRQDLLRRRLQQGKILLVMDDIWKHLKLEDVGYTFEDNQKGCKLLLTSRFHKVLVHNEIKIEKQFPVGILLKEEATNLFKKIIGDSAKNHEIQQTMLQIVKECSGLPVAITTVANALKNEEDIRVWKDALHRFKFSDTKTIDGMDEKVYKSIKWSYEFLKDNDAKSLWLLCSLHGEDYDIEVEDLTRFCVGWNLFGDLGNIEQVRCRVSTLVKHLKDCSLLLDGDDNGTVKMHDIIRDVAIDIAAEERHMFTIRSSVELKNRSKSKNSTAILLPYVNDELELPNQFESSKLELLLLFRQKIFYHIPDSFFEGLKNLRVLKLSQNWSGVLPSSLSSLENLQTLCLENEVQNAIKIGELKNLKALSLSLLKTEWLPKEIGQLTHLQLLDLRQCSKLKFIPTNVLYNLKRLEELYLPDRVEWEVEVQSTEKINAMVSELDHLSRLTKLHICIENAKILPRETVFKRLESYRIAIGSAWSWSETSETSRILKLKISFQSDHGYKALFTKCENLILDEMKGVKNILYELDSEGFQSLKHLTVQHNDEIQYIIKSMGVLGSVFPILESIKLSYMINLERICYTRLPADSFHKLRVVKVIECRNLEFVFSSSMIGCFSHLQEMQIVVCEKMSEIIAIERKEEIEVNSDDNIMFTKLRSLKLRKLLKLKGFFSDDESLVLFNGKVVFPNLEELEIEGMDSMKMIWPDQLILDSFCKLENLTVSNFTNLTNIFPPNMLRTLQNLKHLKIDSCGSIEEVYEIRRTNNVEETQNIAATEIRSLELTNLGKLKPVWSMDSQGIITFAKLRTIKIEGCSSLKSVFPTYMAKTLMQLVKLEIKDCPTVEEIVAKEEGIETTTLFVFPQLTTLELQNLPELKSFYPGKHTSDWPLLNRLTICKCDKLKIFGSNKESVEETNELGHDVCVIQDLFFFSEKDKFPNLEWLYLDEGDAMNETCGGPSAEFCCNPKALRLYGNGEIPNVEAPIARVGVSDFRRLKNIVPFSSTSFHNLVSLEVYGSDVLISLLTPSTARTLVQLVSISIYECKRMTEIIANEGSEAEAGDEIAFNNLTNLHLRNLPSLTAFHLGNCTIKFPSLYDASVKNCPKLKIFDSGILSMRNLESLALDVGDAMNEACGGPLAEFCCNLTDLTLYGNDEIPNVEAPIARAVVSDFRRLKNIVPFSSTSFHNLTKLSAFGCDVLISLLTPSTARTLVQLVRISIYSCKRMREIVANEGSEAEAGDEIAFNNLTDLVFHSLPSLTAFHLGNHTIKFPSLDYVEVSNCPKLKIFWSGVLSTPKLTRFWMERKQILKKKGDGDGDLNATIKEYWEAKLETCDQKFAEKIDASDGEESEHDANYDLERETTSEVGDTQCDGE